MTRYAIAQTTQESETKWCSMCGQDLAVDVFYRESTGRLSTYCKACQKVKNRARYDSDPEVARQASKRYREENPEKVAAAHSRWLAANAAYAWKRHLKKKYALTPTEYEAMVEEQGGCCAICGMSSVRRLCVDHDHSTGKVRSLLCMQCNAGIGNFREDPMNLKRAMYYLEVLHSDD